MQPPKSQIIATKIAPRLGSSHLPRFHDFARPNEAGFTLAEIAVALGIFSFALVSMMGMLSVGLKNSRKATVQTSASNVMAGIVSDIKASTITPPVLSSSSQAYKYLSPKLGISADLEKSDKQETNNTVTSVGPGMPLYLNDSCSLVDSKSPEALQKIYSVQISPAASGIPAVRVRIEWPALRQPNSRPEGYLETLVPLPL